MDTLPFSRYLALAVGLVQPWDHNDSDLLHPYSNSFDDDATIPSARSTASINETTSPPTRLRHGYNDQTSQVGQGDEDYDGEWWYTMLFILAFFLVVLLSYLVREGFSRICGGACCPESLLQEADRSLHRIRNSAQAPTSPLTQEERQAIKLQKQRQERRLWYQYYLKPYIVVLTASNFKTSEQDEEDSLEKEEEPDLELGTKDEFCRPCDESVEEGKETRTSIRISTDGDAEHEGNTTPASGLYAALEENTKMMTLWDPHDTCYREIEANCTICYDDYKVGDTLVRSAADEEGEYCTHVFHYECMMEWLEKGKKRCPICRHWFVPAIRIHQQMQEAHVETHPDSVRHLYDSRTMQGLASLQNDTDSVMSGSSNIDDDHHQGIPVFDVGHHRHASMGGDPASHALDLDIIPAALSTSIVNNQQHDLSARSGDRPTRRRSYPSHSALVLPSDYQASLREWSLHATYDV
ncbi:expressed unknown protein [Seminavis robusta]|uniref:RING-type domain-containing protein n=1 Tax=Seminavis robusta TaxID=568900 RepID=A0A9N8E517_9STRA|nr:expressed unknown protein [Seminavis robusta]|eukprot:Sro667_g184200.1 n/a (467) ;mRNA; r:35169-36673